MKWAIGHPKNRGKKYNIWLGEKKKVTHRDELREAIDIAMMEKPANMDAFLKLLSDAGWEIKHGKQLSFRRPGQKRFMRMDTLGEEYSEDAFNAIFKGVKTHKPKLKLTELKTPAIQRLYNSKLEQGLSPKSIKNLHGCLHKALDTAVKVGYLVKNPSSACILPRVVQPEIKPLDTPDLTKLLNALHGHEYETLITVDIFTGLRSGELIGLTWDCVDFENGLIRVVKQLLLPRKKGEVFRYGTLKNDKTRTIAPAPFIMDMLKKHKAEQKMQRLRMGSAWEDEGFPDLVFTYSNGHHLTQWNVCRALQKVLKDNGMDPHRFHDLRHTFVVNSFRAGDDAKTVQQNAGHYSAAFTLDRYAHVTATMRKESAERMQKFFERLG